MLTYGIQLNRPSVKMVILGYDEPSPSSYLRQPLIIEALFHPK